MVDPLYILAITLGAAFLLPLFDKMGRGVALAVFYTVLAVMAAGSAFWFVQLMNGASPMMVYTAGFQPPFSINLQVGMQEALFLLLVNIAGLAGAVYMHQGFREKTVYAMMLFMVLFLGLDGMIMTRDLFNLFVFIEIASIATYALVSFDEDLGSLAAGFKYMIAGSIASAFFLIGTIYLYRLTGTLNLDGMIEARGLLTGNAGFVALFFIFVALIIELKPFPINGWALDTYEGTAPGFAAMISAAIASTSFFVIVKVYPLFGEGWLDAMAWIGLGTFFGSNLIGMMQHKARRLLGYSSVGQIGLLLAVVGLSSYLGDNAPYIVLGLLVTHYLAKAGLFWLAGIVKEKDINDWGRIASSPLLMFLMGTFVFALMGMPPFPSFFAKWKLVLSLSSAGMYGWVVMLLLGSFFEAIYLMRWFGYAVKKKSDEPVEADITGKALMLLSAVALFLLGWLTEGFFNDSIYMDYIPLLFALVIFLVDFLPAKVKGVLTIGAMSYYAWLVLPNQQGFALIFNAIFLVGGAITMLASLTVKGQRRGFYPLAIIMFIGLSWMTEAGTLLQFFIAWEFMTIGSYLLILRGKKSMDHALSYILFSLGGAYLILIAFGVAYGVTGGTDLTLNALAAAADSAGPLLWVLLALGFLTKAAGFGLHIWLPGAHAEAESDVSPLVSAILLKAGVYGLIVMMVQLGAQSIGSVSLPWLLSWLGAITALGGNMGAIFQEDAKRLLAYSSIGQLGYIIFGLSMMTQLGWMMALLYSVNHFLYKAILFLAIGGVYMRTHTKNMYEMGGLIKFMPLTFLSSLMAIIALAGIPPLAGFAGKWLMYNSLVEKGYLLQGVVVVFAGMVAFLYSFRFLHTIYLGQIKDNLRKVKEAPFFMLLPQYIMLAVIMVLSVRTDLVLKPFGALLADVVPGSSLKWDGLTAHSIFGYWNPMYVMISVGVIFASVFVYLWVNNRKAIKVKQFNIVYAGEAPSRPETTHFAYNFFAPYKRALGFLASPVMERFWDWVSDSLHGISGMFRRIYTGNGQTYALYIMIFTVILYSVMTGGF